MRNAELDLQVKDAIEALDRYVKRIEQDKIDERLFGSLVEFFEKNGYDWELAQDEAEIRMAWLSNELGENSDSYEFRNWQGGYL